MQNKNKFKSKVLLVNRCVVLNKQGKFLLLQRSKNDSYDPMMWEFPGGKLEEGEDVSQALEKEILEEAGIIVNPLERIAYVESQLNLKGKYKGYTYVLLIGIGLHKHGKVTLSNEHNAYVWVTEKEALGMDLRNEIRRALLVLSKTIKKATKK